MVHVNLVVTSQHPGQGDDPAYIPKPPKPCFGPWTPGPFWSSQDADRFVSVFAVCSAQPQTHVLTS